MVNENILCVFKERDIRDNQNRKIVYCPHCKEIFYLKKEIKDTKICDTCKNIFSINSFNIINEIILDDVTKGCKKEKIDNTVFSYLEHGMASDLPVSSFKNMEDGVFKGGLSKLEKRGISNTVPSYDKDKCMELINELNRRIDYLKLNTNDFYKKELL